jgi:hypothetical protein
MRAITEEIRKVGLFHNLTTDKGSEFTSSAFRNSMKKEEVVHHLVDTGDKNKMGKVERFHRTLRGLIQKHMTANNTANWVGVLPDLLENYNNTYHSRIKSTPNDADLLKIIGEERGRTEDVLEAEMENYLEVGDKVRLLRPKETFEKGGQQYYKGIYSIHSINRHSYTLKNAAGAVLENRVKFYEVERVGEVEGHLERRKGVDAVALAKKSAKVEDVLQREGLEKVKNLNAARPKRQVKLKVDENNVEKQLNITRKREKKAPRRFGE